MGRKKKEPKVAQMGYSGVSEKELAKFKKELIANGAKDVTVQLDEDTMREFPDEGKFYLVDYFK